MGRDAAHRQASCRVGSRRGGFQGGYKGRRGSLSEAGGVKAPTHLRAAPVRSPEDFAAPTAEGAQQKRGVLPAMPRGAGRRES